jgi:hypothetical protein
VAQKIEFFVSEDRKIRGPVRLEQLRREFESGDQAEKNVLFRMEGCKRFLPGNAWDPLSDLFSAPSTIDRPDGVVAEKPPRDLATLEPEARDKLLWFVEDADGVMGPVTGAFIARGLMTGRIPITASVSLVSVAGWIRATALFPAALEGATEIRMRPLLGTYSCPYCLEPVIIGSTHCLMCNENVAMGEPGLSMQQVASLVAGTLAIVIIPLIVGAFSARSSVRNTQTFVETPVVDAAGSSSAPGAPASASAATSADAHGPSTPNADGSVPDKPSVKGEILAQFDVPTDTDDAFVLARGHVAIVRHSALDIIDPKSGVIVTSSHDVPGARKLWSLQGALYAVGAARIGVLDPTSLRLTKWVDIRGPFLPGAANRELAIFPSVVDRSVIVVGAPYHVELSRFRFANDIPGFVAIEPDGVWGAAAVGDPRGRIDAIATFALRVAPDAQIVRRTAMGDGVISLAARNGRAYAGLAGGRVASVTLDSSSIPAKPLASADTCKEPAFVLAGPVTIAVGCRAGQAVALHALATLEQETRIELGAPVVAMEISPAGDQMLVATGAPTPGLFVVDLPAGATRRVSVTGEISSVAFGEVPGRATAYSARSHRVWVLE